jgi:hypothetical protein
MKIDYAINSSDDSEMYLGLWPVVKQGWLRMHVNPILIKVTDNGKPYSWEDDFTYILPVIPGIKSSFQAQIARIWAYKLFNGNLILSDVDMLPISKDYFVGTASLHPDDAIVSYCSDAAQKFDGYEPMCYILANSNVMAPLIAQETWEEFVKYLADVSGQGWSCDQWHITTLIMKYDQEKVVRLKRQWTEGGGAFNRIDRTDWRYDKEMMEKGYYYDAHLLRPYSEHKEEIDKLIAAI